MKRRTLSSTIEPRGAYSALLAHFGVQGWWPTTRPGKTAPEYLPRPSGAADDRERFEICAGALLTQNTAWTNVEKAIANLNRARALHPARIARMPDGALERLLRPSGYYRQKTARLKNFSRYLNGKHGGRLASLFAQPLEAAREELLALSGIGPETADSMLLYAGGRPVFVIDAYTRRMGERLGWYDGAEAYGELQGFFQERLPRSVPLYNEFHALIVALCKDFCRKTARCGGCPLAKRCRKAG